MRRRAAEWRLRLLLAALSIVLTVAVLEVAARVLLRPSAPRAALGTPISEFSETLGWRTRAGGAQRIRREDFEVTIAINSLGLRGPEIAYAARPGIRRLAVMGDSFAHGYYAEEPETLRGRLARALDSCELEVLNAGGPGYSTDQEWIYFTEEIRKYEPREVVLLFYSNDLQFNIEAMGTAEREKPVFVERKGRLELLTRRLSPPSEGDPGSMAQSPARPSAPTFRGSALWGFGASRLQRSRPDWSKALSGYGITPAVSLQPPREFLPFGPIDDHERALVEEMWRRTTALLQGFGDHVRATGAGFSVFYVPARFEVNDEAWTFVRRRYEPNRPWNRDAVSTRIESVLTALDIPLLEATEALRAAEKTEAKAYLPLDGHWNSLGNEIAFQTVFPAMRRAFSCGT